MTPQEYADRLIEEYENIISHTIGVHSGIQKTAIKCAVKHIQAQIYLTEPGDSNDIELTESLNYIKSLING